MRFLIVVAALFFAQAHAITTQNTCVWIGDSIDSITVAGQYNEGAVHLIEAERNISLRNLSWPGATLGAPGVNGFNSAWLTDTLDHICGATQTCGCIVFAVGSNDPVFFNWATEFDALNRVFAWVEARGKKVLMVDLIWRADLDTGAVIQPMNMTFTTLRTARRMTCAAHPTSCFFAPRPAEFDAANPSLYGDGVHLVPAGQRVRADWVMGYAAQAGLF